MCSSIWESGSWKRLMKRQSTSRHIQQNIKHTKTIKHLTAIYCYKICTTKTQHQACQEELCSGKSLLSFSRICPLIGTYVWKKSWTSFCFVFSVLYILHSVDVSLRPLHNTVRESFPCALVPLLGSPPSAVSGPGRDTKRIKEARMK